MRLFLGSAIAAFAVVTLIGCGDAKKDEMRRAEQDAREKAAKEKAAEKPAAQPTSDKPPVASSDPKEAVKDPAPSSDPKPSGDTQTVKIGEYSMNAPANWSAEKPSSNMRAAQFKIPKTGDDKEDAELAVFTLGGGLEPNIKRWAGQFGGDDSIKGRKTVKTAGGAEAVIVEFEGTYTAMTMKGSGEPQAGYKMIAAYIVTNGKEFQFKLPGPAATVDASKAGFEKMIESFK